MSLLGKFKSKFEQAVKERGVKETGEEKKKVVASKKATDSDTKPKNEDKKVEAVKNKETGNAYRVLVRPIVTEKSAILAGEGKYVFMVSAQANKIEIKKAVKSVYDVMPLDVNIISNKGKKVRFGRFIGQRKDWKKAVVTLPKGKTIPIYE